MARCHIVVAETDAEAQRIARPAYAKLARILQLALGPQGGGLPIPYPETLDAHMAAGLGVAGSPASVRDFLVREFEAAGADGVLGHMMFGSMSYEDTLELFAREVMPALKKNRRRPEAAAGASRRDGKGPYQACFAMLMVLPG